MECQFMKIADLYCLFYRSIVNIVTEGHFLQAALNCCLFPSIIVDIVTEYHFMKIAHLGHL